MKESTKFEFILDVIRYRVSSLLLTCIDCTRYSTAVFCNRTCTNDIYASLFRNVSVCGWQSVPCPVVPYFEVHLRTRPVPKACLRTGVTSVSLHVSICRRCTCRAVISFTHEQPHQPFLRAEDGWYRFISPLKYTAVREFDGICLRCLYSSGVLEVNILISCRAKRSSS